MPTFINSAHSCYYSAGGIRAVSEDITVLNTAAALIENNEAASQSLPLQMAERLLELSWTQ